MDQPARPGARPQRYTQILLVDEPSAERNNARHPVLDDLASVNPDEMTPIQALTKIAELKRALGPRNGGA
jgi:DNA mismatch repair protein MutS